MCNDDSKNNCGGFRPGGAERSPDVVHPTASPGLPRLEEMKRFAGTETFHMPDGRKVELVRPYWERKLEEDNG